MPVSAQNILYRDYANKHGLHFKLSVNELFFPNCYLHLQGLLEELDDLEGILMCSIFMLPQDRELRERIYKRFSESGGELHFVLESIVLRTRRDMEELETLFLMRHSVLWGNYNKCANCVLHGVCFGRDRRTGRLTGDLCL